MSLQKWDRSRLVHLHEHGQFTVSEVAKFIDKLLTTAAQEKEEAVAEVVERWRKSIDDEARSCSVKIEEAVKAERERVEEEVLTPLYDQIRQWFVKKKDIVGQGALISVFGDALDRLTPPKNISSNETTV